MRKEPQGNKSYQNHHNNSDSDEKPIYIKLPFINEKGETDMVKMRINQYNPRGNPALNLNNTGRITEPREYDG